MRERLERMLGQTAARDLDPHLPRRVRPDAPPRGGAPRLPLHLHDLRRPGPGPPREGVPRGAGEGPEALLAPRHPRADLAREERARRHPRSTRHVSRRSGIRPSPRRTSSTSGACTPRTPSTSTTCSCSRCRCSSASPRRSSAGASRSATSSSTSTRTRTTRSTASSSCSAASTGTCARSATRTSRSTRSAARTSATSWSSSATSPARRSIALEQNYRSTNNVLRSANSLIEQNTERKPKRLFSELGEGEPVRAIEVEDEHAEARFVAAEIASLIDGGLLGQRDRGLLPDERAVARARGRARPPGRPVPGHRRASLLRARRDPRRDRIPQRPRQPAGRDVAAADREPAAARDRRHVDPASRRIRGEHRAHALPGDGRPRAGRRRARRRAARSAVSTRPWKS